MIVAGSMQKHSFSIHGMQGRDNHPQQNLFLGSSVGTEEFNILYATYIFKGSKGNKLAEENNKY